MQLLYDNNTFFRKQIVNMVFIISQTEKGRKKSITFLQKKNSLLQINEKRLFNYKVRSQFLFDRSVKKLTGNKSQPIVKINK